MKRFFYLFCHFFLPQTCCLCQASCYKEQNGICIDCEQALYSYSHTCLQCSHSLPDSRTKFCGACIKRPPAFDNVACIGPYQGVLRYLIMQFKFHEKLFIGKVLSQLLIKKISATSLPECLIPIPLHFKRLQTRGFNQSQEIARVLSQQLSIPIDKNICKRIRHTLPQATLKNKNRRKNVKNAFILQGTCRYKHIALIDDVLTTGHTASEVARLFKNNGVERVEIWCLGRR